ncbi:MAG: hypothetical protein Q4C65_05110 [Eubacteriales bacterium]|nr:hypothetical protein [Eubacteriales bacterium]
MTGRENASGVGNRKIPAAGCEGVSAAGCGRWLRNRKAKRLRRPVRTLRRLSRAFREFPLQDGGL